MRTHSSVARHARHKKILALAKGYIGSRRYRLRVAKEALLHALSYQYRDRRNRKRDFRRLWITRISAFVRAQGMTYSRFIEGLNKAQIRVDRKMLAYLASQDAEAMQAYVEQAKLALAR